MPPRGRPGVAATRNPFPPPPPAALQATGYPASEAWARASSRSSAGLVAPGTIGTPALDMISRARVFEPIISIASAGGPMKTIPASSQAVANSAFSARKP